MNKRLFIVRHARPEGFEEKGDLERELLPEGVEEHRYICQKLLDQGYQIDQIFSSPVIRAFQTAEIMAELFSTTVEVVDSLSYQFDPDSLIKDLKQAKSPFIAWVGHEPNMSTVVNQLVGKSVLPAGMSKSGVAILDFPEKIAYGSAKLHSYLVPGMT